MFASTILAILSTPVTKVTAPAQDMRNLEEALAGSGIHMESVTVVES